MNGDQIVITTNGTYPKSFWTQIFRTGQPSVKCLKWWFNLTIRNPWFSSVLVSSNPLSGKSR